MKSKISIIAALDEKRGIGRDNKLPWHIPEDLKRFKELTMGHPVIMGRKTFESILEYLKKPLPGRKNIVITRNPGTVYSNRSRIGGEVAIVDSIEKALNKAKQTETDEIFIIGGAQIFDQAISITDNLYLTLVSGDFACDTFFPEYTDFDKEVFREDHPESNPAFTWLTLTR